MDFAWTENSTSNKESAAWASRVFGVADLTDQTRPQLSCVVSMPEQRVGTSGQMSFRRERYIRVGLIVSRYHEIEKKTSEI